VKLRDYPGEAKIEDEVYRFERILKDDFFSVNVLYRNAMGRRYVLKLSDFRFLFGLLFRPFAAAMSRHEYRIYEMVADLEGVPRLGPRHGPRGYFHEYIEGRTLHEIPRGSPLAEDFFDRLRRLIERIHERRIFYLDLNKQGNIIVAQDGRPYLIDYQICMHFPQRRGWYGRWSDRVFRTLIGEDIYHVYKHKRRFQPERLTDEERKLAVRSRLNQRYDRFFGSPYRRVKRLIYPQGSNEIVWYKWKRMKDRSRRMP